jgi:uncharacterized protein (DUF58 family)
MDSTELLKKVRKIEIKSRGLSNQIFSGEYHSAFKGSGMAFSEVREYTPGDEIRKIDWNVTARFGRPFVKVFEEEREMTVMLLVDISGSEDFGSKEYLKREIATEISAVLAFSAIQNNDKIGMILFSDHIEKFIPPKKGKTHILRIIRELIGFEPKSKKTNVAEGLRFLTNAIKKKSTVFVISDFIDKGFYDSLRIANNKHDVVALELYDEREEEMVNMGLVPFQDAESGEVLWLDSSDKKVRAAYRDNAFWRRAELSKMFRKSGVDHARIDIDRSYVRPLMNLFKRREARR